MKWYLAVMVAGLAVIAWSVQELRTASAELKPRRQLRSVPPLQSQRPNGWFGPQAARPDPFAIFR